MSYFGIYHVQKRIRARVLTEIDRERLGETYSPLELIQFYAQLHGRSFERAAVDIAMEGSVIGVGQYRSLRRQIGEPLEERDDAPRPTWNCQTGELFYRGDLIRKVSRLGTDIRRILGAFQELGWPARIDNPLDGGARSKKLRKAVARLNKTLVAVKFYADGTAKGVLWQQSTTSDSGALKGASRRK